VGTDAGDQPRERHADDDFFTFQSEQYEPPVVAPPPVIRRTSPGPLQFGGLALVLVASVGLVYMVTRSETSLASDTVAIGAGEATITSNPAGASVFIGGQIQGQTPLKLSLPAGMHSIEVRSGTSARTIAVPIEAGRLTAQYIELAAPASGTFGRLEVSSEPRGAAVSVDGTARGTTPLMLDAIGAGTHQVTVSSGASTVSRTVNVEGGATATVMIALGATNSAGWVGIRAPFELQVFENGQLIGNTSAQRLMLPAGRHSLDLVNNALQFRMTLPVQIAPGGVSNQAITVPNGSLSVNALPWAEVLIDGVSAGTTPLANLAVAIGQHEITWRHPQYPERRQMVTVVVGTPARVGVDLTQ